MKLSLHSIRSIFAGLILLLIVSAVMADSSILLNSKLSEQDLILLAHNKVRRLHHAPQLVWDDELASYAKRYAEQCEFKHSGSHYGENLAAGYPDIKTAISAWYFENKKYSYEHPGFSHETGHFTQVVWKNTQKIGCGYVTCNGNHGTPGNYLVCEYSPAGNITNRGFFASNVLPV